MAFFNLSEADYAAEAVVDVWPDNWDAVLLFASLRTQWRIDQGDAYGLDYSVLYRKMDRMNLTPDRYEELEEEIQVMEDAAIEQMRKG